MQIALFKAGIIVISSIVIVWISIFLYTAFYWAYMPSMVHMRQVHFEFEPCEKNIGICSFPSANVQLTKKQQLLMVGQPYKINLHLEMPESNSNKKLGMFMVCANLYSRDGHMVDKSCRPTMLHYRSNLLQILKTIVFSPMLVFDTREEKQNVVVELFSSFIENQNHPITSVDIRIQSQNIEFYSAAIGIQAHLSGLRYLMFHWPIISAIIGTCTNLFFIALICVLSYLRFAPEDNGTFELFIYKKKDKDNTTNDKLSLESSTVNETSILDDVQNFGDDIIDTNDHDSSTSRFIEELKPIEDSSLAVE